MPWTYRSSKMLNAALEEAGYRNIDIERTLGRGFDATMISLWRTGKRSPRIDQLEAMIRLAQSRGVKIGADTILGLRDDAISASDIVSELTEIRSRIDVLMKSLALIEQREKNDHEIDHGQDSEALAELTKSLPARPVKLQIAKSQEGLEWRPPLRGKMAPAKAQAQTALQSPRDPGRKRTRPGAGGSEGRRGSGQG